MQTSSSSGSSSFAAGTMQMAAALVFHLPGARLELSSPSGHRWSIGPMTDPRCTMHPAEFRHLVLAAPDSRMLVRMLGFQGGEPPRLTLTSSGVETSHLGAGLYRVAGCETTSFAFTTPLTTDQVDAVLSRLNTASSSPCCETVTVTPADAPCSGRRDVREGDWPDDSVALCANLVRDESLGVTLVAISPMQAEDLPRCEEIAQAAVSACLVAEVEMLTSDESVPDPAGA
ncbi:MAG: hypothetical protein OXD37_05205 [Acidimicrobiaceae bacterium]|nr:hypothetical protein [Acidimicrobiaceae bacterium]